MVPGLFLKLLLRVTLHLRRGGEFVGVLLGTLITLAAMSSSSEVVAMKDPHGRYRPASIIKVLLALTVIDELPLEQKVEVSAESAGQEGSAAGIGEGGEFYRPMAVAIIGGTITSTVLTLLVVAVLVAGAAVLAIRSARVRCFIIVLRVGSCCSRSGFVGAGFRQGRQG